MTAVNSIIDFQKRLLTAILTNDVQDVVSTLDQVLTSLGTTALDHLLTHRWTLTSLGQGHDTTLLRVLRILLLDHLPDLQPEHFRCPGLMLDAHVQAYRGLPVHVAVALGRLDIVRELLDVSQRCFLDCTKQLSATDVCRNTALSLAVRVCHHDSVTYLLGRLDRCSVLTTEFILRHCFAKNAPRLIFCRDYDLGVVLEKVFDRLVKLDGDFEFDHVLLLWYLYLTDDFVLSDVLIQDNVYSCALQEPSPFHFAASVSCVKEFGEEDVNVLRLLESRLRSNDWLEPNAISTFKIGAQTYMSGTAAHFAILNYQPRHLLQIHPGYIKGGTLDKQPPPQEELGSPSSHDLLTRAARPASIARLLGYLQFCHGVDLLKVNLEQKTPLDCLPADADAALVRALVGLQRRQRSWQRRWGTKCDAAAAAAANEPSPSVSYLAGESQLSKRRALQMAVE